jgi:hypothetical protein
MALHKSIRWRSLGHGGLEQFRFTEWQSEFNVRSTVIGDVGEDSFGVFYEVNLGLDWVVAGVTLQRTDGVMTVLSSDGHGNWTDAHGPRPDLEGCIDIDFEMTPFTNTLPIRRVKLGIGETMRFQMAYIPADTLEPFPDEQIYTRLSQHTYCFEEADGSFTADITVDDDGFVTDYPELFERV